MNSEKTPKLRIFNDLINILFSVSLWRLPVIVFLILNMPTSLTMKLATKQAYANLQKAFHEQPCQDGHFTSTPSSTAIDNDE